MPPLRVDPSGETHERLLRSRCWLKGPANCRLMSTTVSRSLRTRLLPHSRIDPLTVKWATQLPGGLRFAIVESLADWLNGQSAVSFPGALLFDRSRLLVAAGFSMDSASVVSATTPIVAPDSDSIGIPSSVLQLYSGLAYYARSQNWPAIRCLVPFPIDDETRFQFSDCPWEEAAIIQHWCRELPASVHPRDSDLSVITSHSQCPLKDCSTIDIQETDAGAVRQRISELRQILESSDDLPESLRPRAEDLTGNWARLEGVRYFVARMNSEQENPVWVGLVVLCGTNIEYLGVSPHHRRLGIGSALVNESMSAIARNLTQNSGSIGEQHWSPQVTAYSDASNLAANRLYDQMDFHVESKWMLLVWPEQRPAS